MKPILRERLRAIKLRQRGKSYSQIKQELQVSKGSLSLWLRRYPLSKKQLKELLWDNEVRIEKFRNTMRAKRERRLKEIFLKEKERLLPLTEKELLIAGLFLYWGEGGKTSPATVSISNTNPEIIKFFVYWLINILEVPKGKMGVRLHLYRDMNSQLEVEFWSKELGLTIDQFKKPYIKKTTLRGLTYKTFGHGTCNLMVGGRDLIERILMGIKAVADEYTR